MLPRRATATLLAVPLLVLTGCGEVKRELPNKEVATPVALDKPQPTIYPGPTAPPTTAAPTSAAPTATGTGEPTGEPGGANEVQGTAANKFEPTLLEVKAGSKVTWTLTAGHTVTGGKDGVPDAASPIGDSGFGKTSYEVTFDKPGTYPYYCVPHVSLGMTGEIVVK